MAKSGEKWQNVVKSGEKWGRWEKLSSHSELHSHSESHSHSELHSHSEWCKPCLNKNVYGFQMENLAYWIRTAKGDHYVCGYPKNLVYISSQLHVLCRAHTLVVHMD